jgi:hypothetical protein
LEPKNNANVSNYCIIVESQIGCSQTHRILTVAFALKQSFLFLGKVKGKAHPGKSHEIPEGEKKYRSTPLKKNPMYRGLDGTQ